MENFKAKLRTIFTLSDRVKVDVFYRYLPNDEGVNLCVAQVMIYQEGFPDSYLEFESDDELVARLRCPVKEHAIVYSETSGIIEVVAARKQQRDEIAKAFATHLLPFQTDLQEVALCQFDLTPLMSPSTLVYDEVDGIESIQLVMIKLQHTRSVARIQLEIPSRSDLNLYEWAENTLAEHNPLTSEDYYPTQAKLNIRFKPQKNSRRNQVLSFKMTLPDSCDLRSRTSRERLITEKYFKAWGLLKRMQANDG